MTLVSDGLLDLIRRGKITGEVRARKANHPGGYVPITQIPELATALPKTVRQGQPQAVPAPRRADKKKKAGAPRETLQDFITNYDKHERKFRRKKTFRKYLRRVRHFVVAAAVLAGMIAALIYFWPYIKKLLEPGGMPAPLALY